MPNSLYDALFPSSRQRDPLDLIAQHESGGRNIHQNVVPPGGGYNPSVGRVTGPSSAQGPWQITNTTWRRYAPRAGAEQYRSAMEAPVEVQREVARVIFETEGYAPWAPYNASLRAALQRGEGGTQQPRPVPTPDASYDALFDQSAPASAPETPTPAPPPRPRPGLLLPAGERNAGPDYKPTFGGQTRRTPPAFGKLDPEQTEPIRQAIEQYEGNRRLPRIDRTVPTVAELLPSPAPPPTFDEDRAERAARNQVVTQLEGRAGAATDFNGPEYENFLRLNRTTDSRRQRAAFLELRAKQAIESAGGSPFAALQSQDRESARQQRVAKLSTVEKLAQAPKSAALGLTDSLATGLKSIGVVSRKLNLTGEYDDQNASDLATYRAGEYIQNKARELLGSNPDLEQELLVGKAPSTIGQAASFMLGGWATKSPRLAVMVMGGGMTAGDAYDEVKRAGGTDDDAVNAGLLAGAILGPTELIGLRGATKALSGTAREATLRAALKTALREGRKDVIENALQEIGQEWAQGKITEQERSLRELAEAGLLGGIGGTATAPLTLATSRPRTRQEVIGEAQMEPQQAVETERTEAESTQAAGNLQSGLASSEQQTSTGSTVSVDVVPQRFYHTTFGNVVQSSDQSGARKNRIKVHEEGNPDAVHYVRKVDLRGRGNERMVPLKPAAAEAAPTERRGPTRLPDTDWLALTPDEQRRMRNELELSQRFPTAPTPAQTDILSSRYEGEERRSPTRLSEEEFRRNRAAWAGKTELKDESGTPLTFYHFTTEKAEPLIRQHGFDLSKARARLKDEGVPDAVFFTPDPTPPFGDKRSFTRIDAHLKMEKPLRVQNREELVTWARKRDPEYRRLQDSIAHYDVPERIRLYQETQSKDPAVRERAKQEDEQLIEIATKARARLTALMQREGYDGLIMERDEGGPRVTTTYAVLDPRQVKSPRNRGRFDPANPSIVDFQPPTAETPAAPPVPEGYIRYYRADRSDAASPQGGGWSTSLDYVSQKYGTGQMGSESLWYVDVPTVTLEAEYGDAAAASIIRDPIQLGATEPKLLRRSPPLNPAVSPPTELTPQSPATESQLPQQEGGPTGATTDPLAPLLTTTTRAPERARPPSAPPITPPIVTGDVTEVSRASSTAPKDAAMQADRAELGLPELAQLPSVSAEEVLAQARQRNQSNPRSTDALVEQALKGGKNFTNVETTQVNLRAQEVKNRLNEINNEAYRETDPQRLADLRAESDALLNEFDRISEAQDKAGAEWSRAGHARQRAIREDYSLVSLIARAKKAKGRDLTAEEHTRYEEQAARIAELESRLDVTRKQLEEKQLQREVDKLARSRRRGETKQQLDAEYAQLLTEFRQARAEVRNIQPSGLAALDPEGKLTRIILRMARNRVLAGVNSAQQLVDAIYADVKDALPGITERDVRDAISGYSLTPKTKRSDLQKQLAALKSELQQLSKEEDVAAGVRSLRAEGPKPSEIRRVRPSEGPKQVPHGPLRRAFTRNEQRRKQIEQQMADLNRRIAEQDFAPKPKKEKLPYTREVQQLEEQLQHLKNKFELELERAKPGHWLRQLSGIRKSWMLSGLSTQAKNIGGTGGYQIFDEISRLPAVIADAAIAPFTNRRTITANPTAMLDSVIHAATVGRREAGQILRQGATTEQLERHQFAEIDTGVQLIDYTSNFVFRFMSATDRIFYNYAYARNLNDRARAQALNEGAENVRQRTRELAAAPPGDMDAAAKHDALVATFNNNNQLSNAIKRSRAQLGPAANFAIDLVMPFDRTPTNVIARIVEASPVGGTVAATRLAKGIVSQSLTADQQRQFTQTIGRATVGTALMALGWMLAAKDLTDVEKYQVFLNLGEKRRIDLASISPTGNLLALGARLRKDYEKRDKLSAVKTIGAIPLQQPLLKSTSEAVETLNDPARSLTRTGARLASSFIPMGGLVRDIGKAIDPEERRAVTFSQQVQQNIPILRQRLPVKPRPRKRLQFSSAGARP